MKRSAELARLVGLVTKYRHRWGDNPSLRLQVWVDRVNEIKQTDPALWQSFCLARGWDPDSDGYDLLA